MYKTYKELNPNAFNLLVYLGKCQASDLVDNEEIYKRLDFDHPLRIDYEDYLARRDLYNVKDIKLTRSEFLKYYTRIWELLTALDILQNHKDYKDDSSSINSAAEILFKELEILGRRCLI